MPCASITVEIKNIISYSGKFSQGSIVVDGRSLLFCGFNICGYDVRTHTHYVQYNRGCVMDLIPRLDDHL